MRIRPALLSAILVASTGLPFVAAAAAEFTTTGTVVATGRDSIVVRIDDHGHRIPFAIEKPSVLPAGVAVGSRVSVAYHPTGTTGQAADTVTLLQAAPPKAPRSKTPAPAKKSPEQPNS
jgi:hypothetical protein